MEESYQIAYVEKPEEEAWGIIGRGVQGYNIEQAGDNQFQRICFVVLTSNEEIVGGVLGELYWGWLHVDLLWIQEGLRDRGYGQQLLMRAEDEARKRGAAFAYLDTFSFQAPDFYRKQGYEVFGELPDFPHGHKRYFMRKHL